MNQMGDTFAPLNNFYYGKKYMQGLKRLYDIELVRPASLFCHLSVFLALYIDDNLDPFHIFLYTLGPRL